MASYQPGNGEITGSVPPPPPPPRWTWEGGTPIIVAPGETVEMLSRKYHVPVSAIIQANNMSDAAVHAGQHLVIPRYRPSAVASAPRASSVASEPSAPPRTAVALGSSVHVVSPGETLNSIARLYGKPVMVLARANNIPPDTMVKVGERIIIPGVETKPRAEAPVPAHRELAKAQSQTPSPSSAFKATPVEPPTQTSPVKPVETVGAVPNFRWPVRGRIIAGFGASPNGSQNDGIDLAVPQGTPVKAADDGVVAYAGNELKGYGNLVLIRHDNGYVTAYAHASEILVKRGESVKRGQVIAKSGETGSVKAPELHFEIRKGATPVDPAQFLSGA
jgi:murein DD-endopeptidase MepM/ murein hydrolase activator NlpD